MQAEPPHLAQRANLLATPGRRGWWARIAGLDLADTVRDMPYTMSPEFPAYPRSPLPHTAKPRVVAPFLPRRTLLNRPLRVGFDLDGVVYDFVDSVRRYLLTHGWRPEQMPDAQNWEFFLDWGMELREFLSVCHAGVDHGTIFATGTPLPGALDAARKIAAAGHEIHIITDRTFGTGDASADATRSWLREVEFPYTTLTISADKACVPTDVYIDDRDINFLALLEAGIDAYLIDRPWNRHVSTDRRLASVAEYADLLVTAA